MTFAFPPPAPVAVPIVGSDAQFPVHRIYCVGRNYAEHAQEMGFSGREPPFFFMKPADAVLAASPGSTAALPYPSLTNDLQHEVELVIAIGSGGTQIAPQQAHEHIFGYAVGLDMTRRDLQAAMKKQGRPWCISKGFEHSAPIGSITPRAQAGAIEQAGISLHVNGQLRQHSHISALLWNIAETISHLSQAWTLQPGDLIYSGTPAGVAAVLPGDLLEARVDGLQPLSIRVA